MAIALVGEVHAYLVLDTLGDDVIFVTVDKITFPIIYSIIVYCYVYKVNKAYKNDMEPKVFRSVQL